MSGKGITCNMNRQLFQDCGNVSGMHRYFKNMWILFHTLSSFKKFEGCIVGSFNDNCKKKANLGIYSSCIHVIRNIGGINPKEKVNKKPSNTNNANSA